VGDIEGLPYIETLRQLSVELGKARIICIHLTYIPYIKVVGEMKTKPTQHSVKQLQSMGVQPDIILCRTELPLSDEVKGKLSMFCNVPKDNVMAAMDADNIYLIPSQYHSAGLDMQICKHFGLDSSNSSDSLIEATWKSLERVITAPARCAKIAVVGKYTKLKDAYISLTQAIMHGGFANDARVAIKWINAEDSLAEIKKSMSDVSGLLIPGGFSSRGSEGKIAAIRYAREHNIPFFGICLGMQLAVIEACRNVAQMATATSREFADEGDFVVDFMESWTVGDKKELRDVSGNLGGTMRLGEYTCRITPGSLAFKIYGASTVVERHRHRYEINLARYASVFEEAGLIFSGVSEDGELPELLERRDHRFFIATQAHPEFKSAPFTPHPLFVAFIRAVLAMDSASRWDCQ
jgi:CTP synthase